jgi:hypothetical protein
LTIRGQSKSDRSRERLVADHTTTLIGRLIWKDAGAIVISKVETTRASSEATILVGTGSFAEPIVNV